MSLTARPVQSCVAQLCLLILLAAADIPGFQLEDIDGDGDITMMRIPDPGGNYKICKSDPRVMEPRLPEEVRDILTVDASTTN
eukprot:SAG31_NODE_214_length_20084_cov_2.644684_6_plen_83_part_00